MEPPTADHIAALTPAQYKTLETKARRYAARQNLQLHRVRRIDRHAADYGEYWLDDRLGREVARGDLPAIWQYLLR